MNYIQLEASYCLPIFIRLRSETEKGVKYIDLAQPALRRLKQNLRLYVLPVFTSWLQILHSTQTLFTANYFLNHE